MVMDILQEVKALTPLEVLHSPPVPVPVCHHQNMTEAQSTLMMDLSKKALVNSIADSPTQMWMVFMATIISSIVTLQPLSLYQRYIWTDPI